MGYRKKIYYVILCTVTIACIIAGLARHFLKIGTEGRNIFGFISPEEEIDDISGSYSEELDRFLSLEIGASAADIVIEYGENYGISGVYLHGMKPEYNVRKGRLVITQLDVAQEHILGARDKDCVVTVTIPEGAYVSTVDVSLDVGELTINRLRAFNMNIRLGTGNILTNGAGLSKGFVEIGTGIIKMQDLSFDDLNVVSGNGEVSLSTGEDLEDCSMELSTKLGDVKVEGESFFTNYEKKSGKSRRLVIDSETGNVTVEKNTAKAQ